MTNKITKGAKGEIISGGESKLMFPDATNEERRFWDAYICSAVSAGFVMQNLADSANSAIEVRRRTFGKV